MATRPYETVFILTPVLSEQQMKDTVSKFKEFLQKNDVGIYHEEAWGIKKLAYPIRNKKTGFYQLFEFNAEPELIEKLHVEFRRDERVMRFQVVHLDKYAVEYNQKRRHKIKVKAQEKAQQEAEEAAQS